MVDVLISLPYALEDAAGNSVTAIRLRRQLREIGLNVAIMTPRDHLIPARCLVALNAWRSAEVIASFPGPVVILLTGTDINDERVQNSDWEGRIAMEKAEALVVLQQVAAAKVPERLREKCQTILPSVKFPHGLKWQGSEGETVRIILGARHRPEKQPDLVLEACRRLNPASDPVTVEWYGALKEETAPCFQWKGPVTQEELWREMARADFFLNASSEEGGANAVCEAIAMGLPVLASRIGGNVGLLGDDYEGYFESGDAQALADLMKNPPGERLKEQITLRQPLYEDAQEARAWQQLLLPLIRGV